MIFCYNTDHMRKIIFDIETSNAFGEIESRNAYDLDLSVIVIHDSKTDEYTSFKQDELHKLWPILEETDIIIGYNSDHFDLPLLNKYYEGDLGQIKSLDILAEIKEQFGRRMKLDQIAAGTLGTAKSADGLQAVRWWRNGEYEKVIKYCIDDVKITKQIYDFAMKNSKLIFKEGGKKITIPLDTSKWDILEEAPAMTHSLPF
jgi:DEAD/DEAH box helicase domain-containing protein